jgi:hypothetical protein
VIARIRLRRPAESMGVEVVHSARAHDGSLRRHRPLD